MSLVTVIIPVFLVFFLLYLIFHGQTTVCSYCRAFRKVSKRPTVGSAIEGAINRPNCWPFEPKDPTT